MPPYDFALFDPPAPVAMVSLRLINDGDVLTDVPMLIDSGADLTMVPATRVDQLKLDIRPEDDYPVEAFDGRRSVARSVKLELTFLGRTFRGRFLVLDSQTGILGRNVLNHFALLLDGPQLSWQEQKNSGK